MQIWLNGETREVPAGYTLADLIAELDLAERRLAVEINQAIVPRSGYAQRPLRESDRVEIIQAVGGG